MIDLQRLFAVVGMLLQVVGFILLTILPANFDYLWFALILVLLGLGQGLFSAPNTTLVMNSVPPEQRGVASGMRATFMNTASVISLTMFFSLVTAGLAASLPTTLSHGLTQVGLPGAVANQIAQLPPIAALFAAFLGYNPMQTLLPPAVLHSLPQSAQATLLGKEYFPTLISSPFMDGMHLAFYIAAAVCLIAAIASLVRGKQAIAERTVEFADGGSDSLGEEEGEAAAIQQG